MTCTGFRLATVFALALPAVAAAHGIPAEIAARIDASSAPAPPPGEPTLDEMRATTERFRHVETALAEGYIRDPADMRDDAAEMGRAAEMGAMGIHFFRPDLLGISAPPTPRVDGVGAHTDFGQPAVLIYEPQPEGGLGLVAVENLVFKAAWEAAGNGAPPSFHGVPWDEMVDDPATALDEAHNFMPHYDRHVWLYRENPNGVFAQYNPSVTCAHHGAARPRARLLILPGGPRRRESASETPSEALSASRQAEATTSLARPAIRSPPGTAASAIARFGVVGATGRVRSRQAATDRPAFGAAGAWPPPRGATTVRPSPSRPGRGG